MNATPLTPNNVALLLKNIAVGVIHIQHFYHGEFADLHDLNIVNCPLLFCERPMLTTHTLTPVGVTPSVRVKFAFYILDVSDREENATRAQWDKINYCNLAGEQVISRIAEYCQKSKWWRIEGAITGLEVIRETNQEAVGVRYDAELSAPFPYSICQDPDGVPFDVTALTCALYDA